MADDTRDSRQTSRGPPPGASAPPDHVKTPQIYEVFHAPSSANDLPEGSGQNTAGARPEVPSLNEAIKTVRLGDFRQVYMYPCVRDSLLTGIGGAFAVGGIRGLMGTPVMKACNWAVGTFCFLGIGSYEFCLQKRKLEKANMKRAVEIIDRKKAEKEAQAQAKREERRRVKEEADRKLEESKRSSWKFW
ncbi:MAG: hypothetical protein M1818_007810 [Claussenomyces sp. TS43310]|nr:MAG: hypothetical protein M1818_007810 [Claussenomyces sp. TS43310]